ncbi:MAG: O-antigen ligase family protein [Pseudomonadota bacterium]
MKITISERTPRRLSWSLSNVAGLIFLISLVSPFVGAIGHGLKTTWPAFLLWTLAIIFDRTVERKAILNVIVRQRFELLMLVCWTLVVLINFILGRGYTGGLHLINTLTFDMLVFFGIIYTAKKDDSYKIMAIWFFVLIGFEVIRSIPVILSQPFLARNITTTMSITSESAGLSSVGEYTYYTGLANIFPALLGISLISSGFRKIELLLFCGFIGFAIAMSTLLGAFLLMISGICFMFILTPILKYRLKLGPFLLLFIFIIVAICVWQYYLNTSVQGFFLTEKLIRQVDSVFTRGLFLGDLTNRSALWEMSINTIQKYPFFGVGPSTGTYNPYYLTYVGGHSSWLDLPAEYGLIGFGFFVAFLFAAMKRTFNVFRYSKNIYSLGCIVSCIIIIIGGSFNPSGIGSIAFTLVQFFVFSGRKESIERNNSAIRRRYKWCY